MAQEFAAVNFESWAEFIVQVSGVADVESLESLGKVPEPLRTDVLRTWDSERQRSYERGVTALSVAHWHAQLEQRREVQRRMERSVPSPDAGDVPAAGAVAALDPRLDAFLQTDLGKTVTAGELSAMVEFDGLNRYLSEQLAGQYKGCSGVASWGLALVHACASSHA